MTAPVLASLLSLCPSMGQADAREAAAAIVAEAPRRQLDPFLLVALAKVESECSPRVVNRRSRTRGLLQLWRGWAKGRDLLDVRVNVAVGAEVLAMYVSKCGSVAGGIAAYNRRPDAKGRPVCKDSRFSRKVRRLYLSIVPRTT